MPKITLVFFFFLMSTPNRIHFLFFNPSFVSLPNGFSRCPLSLFFFSFEISEKTKADVFSLHLKIPFFEERSWGLGKPSGSIRVERASSLSVVCPPFFSDSPAEQKLFFSLCGIWVFGISFDYRLSALAPLSQKVPPPTSRGRLIPPPPPFPPSPP